MLLRIFSFHSWTPLLLAGLCLALAVTATAQEPSKPGAPPTAPVKPEPDRKSQTNNKTPPAKAAAFDPKNPTAENIVEGAILVSGGRATFDQIRRYGLERGKRSIAQADGKLVEGTYETRFKRGDNSEQDQVRVDQQTPIAYSLVYAKDEDWGVLNGSVFSPRAEIVHSFRDQLWHDLDGLFRYKEDGSTLTLIGKEKHAGVEVYVVDLAYTAKMKPDPNSAPEDIKVTTRYYISVKLLRVLWLEYESTAPDGTTRAKYMRRFYDYKVVQGTLVPYRTVLLRDGERIEETNVLTVTYGIKMDDAMFAKG